MVDSVGGGGGSTSGAAAAAEAARRAAMEAARRAAEERARAAAEQLRDQHLPRVDTGPFATRPQDVGAASTTTAPTYSVAEAAELARTAAPIGVGEAPPTGPSPDDEVARELRNWVVTTVRPEEVGSILDGSHPELELLDLGNEGLPFVYQQVVVDAALDRWVPADEVAFETVVAGMAEVDDTAVLAYAANQIWQRSLASERIPGALTTQDYAAAAARIAAADPAVARQFVGGLGEDLPAFVDALGLDDRLLSAEINVDQRNEAALALLASVAQDPVALELAGQYLAHMEPGLIRSSEVLVQVLEPVVGEGTRTLLALPDELEGLLPLQVVALFAPYAGSLSLEDARTYADRPDLYLAQLQGLDLVGSIAVAGVPAEMVLELPSATKDLFPALFDGEMASVLPEGVASRWLDGRPTMQDLTLLIEQGFLDPDAMIGDIQAVYGAVQRLGPMSAASSPAEVIGAGIIELSGGIDALDYAKSAAGHLWEMFGNERADLGGADPARQAEILYGALLQHQAASTALMPMYADLVAGEGRQFLGNYYATLHVAADITTEIGTYVFAAAALSAGVPPAASTATFRAGVSMIFDAAFQRAETGGLDAGSWFRVGAGNFVQGYFAALPIGQGGNAAAWAARHLQGLSPRTAAILGTLFAGTFATTSSQSGAILGSWIVDPTLMPQTPQERRDVLASLAAAAASGVVVQGPLSTLLTEIGYPGLGTALGEVEQEVLQNVMVSTAENLAKGMPFDEALAAATSLENNASSIFISAVLGTVTNGVADGDSQVQIAARAQSTIDRLVANGEVVLPGTLADVETRLGLLPGTLQAPPAFADQTVASADIDATLAALGLQDDAEFRASLEKIAALEEGGMSLANVGTVQAAAVSRLAQEYGVDIAIVGRLADDLVAADARARSVALADSVVARLGIPGVETLADLKQQFGAYPAAVIQQAVSTTLRNEGVMIEPWQVKVSSGGSEVDAIIPHEQWSSLDERQRLELTAAMRRIFGVEEVDWYQAIHPPSAEAAAEQWASVGVDVETVVRSVAAATGLSVEEARAIVTLPQNGIYLQGPGTPTFNAIEFFSNGDVIHPNLAGARSAQPDGKVHPRPE
jgi:hypothetical protein